MSWDTFHSNLLAIQRMMYLRLNSESSLQKLLTVVWSPLHKTGFQQDMGEII